MYKYRWRDRDVYASLHLLHLYTWNKPYLMTHIWVLNHVYINNWGSSIPIQQTKCGTLPGGPYMVFATKPVQAWEMFICGFITLSPQSAEHVDARCTMYQAYGFV